MSTTRTLYNGRDSNISYQLLDNGVAQDLSNLTQIDFVFTSAIKLTGLIGSTAPIDFSTDQHKILLNLGESSVTAGAYPTVKVVVYDGDNPSGLVWGTISLVVENNPYTG